MQKILAFTGKKQAGKSSAAKFVVGQVILKEKMFDECKEFRQTAEGDVLLKIRGDNALLPMYPNKESLSWYNNVFYPKVRVYSFATDLKLAVCKIFGVPEEWVFGSEEDKNKITKIRWGDVFTKDDRVNPLFLTVRELLQEFGQLCRKIKPDCWVQSLTSKLSSDYCLVDDLRYDNEAEILKEMGAIIIDLEGGIGGDNHSSEAGIDKKFIDFTVDRSKEGFEYKNKQILDYLLSEKFFGENK